MNKYVRTKDYIEKINNEAHIKDNKVCRFNIAPIGNFYDINESIIIWDNIIKQADTIEELCDEFVLFYGDVKSSYIPWATYERRDNKWNVFKEKLIEELQSPAREAIVLGAIWTDKGLIYVAKMNDKGELELI